MNHELSTNNELRTMNSFIQNKANLQKGKMNVSPFNTMNYEQITMNCEAKNKANTNPNEPKFFRNLAIVRYAIAGDYKNDPDFWLKTPKSNSKQFFSLIYVMKMLLFYFQQEESEVIFNPAF